MFLHYLLINEKMTILCNRKRFLFQFLSLEGLNADLMLNFRSWVYWSYYTTGENKLIHVPLVFPTINVLFYPYLVELIIRSDSFSPNICCSITFFVSCDSAQRTLCEICIYIYNTFVCRSILSSFSFIETVTAYKIKRIEIPGPRATLIVCPLSVLHNWQVRFFNVLDVVL